MIILTHPTGNEFVRALTEGLVKKGVLLEFNTCVAIFRNSSAFSLTEIGILQDLRKRIFSEEVKPYTRTRPYRELIRIAAQKINNRSLIEHEKGRFSVDSVYRNLDLRVSESLTNGSAVYSYEDGALHTFQRASAIGINCLYDLPIGYWREMHKLLEEERQKKPEWAETITGFKDSEAKLNRKDAELQLADKIFVASSFTADTLKSFPGKIAQIHVIPYGFPPVTKNRTYLPFTNRKLKVLFVGGLSQRKGVAYLFEAVNEMKEKVELTVVGRKPVPNCKILNENLMKYNWIPALPHSEILKLMKSQDLLVFPSLFEGFGLVITEAMSQGTPVITTNRTCGPDLIIHDKNGWIIETGSTKAIITQLEDIIANPGKLKKVGEAAMETAGKRSWETYGMEMSNTISTLIENKLVS